MNIRDHWISLLHRTAIGTKKTRITLTPVGLVIFGVFTSLFVIISILIDRWLTLPWLVSRNLSWIIAMLLIAFGVSMTTWSAAHFLKVKGTPVPFNPPPKLVITGPYQFVRNPMLTGVFSLLFGIGFAVNSLSLVVLFTPLYILAHLWEIKEIEEPELVKRFGEEYAAYQKRTPIFIPRMRSGK